MPSLNMKTLAMSKAMRPKKRRHGPGKARGDVNPGRNIG